MSLVLNRRLVLEEPVRVADGAGGFTQTWIAKGTLWAAVKPGTGRERFGAAASLSSIPYRIVVRGAAHGAPSRPRADQRFREGARVYSILGVSEYDADTRYLTCYSIEETSA
jgi:SPP1 family predicted phage head-tail adaptor